MIELVKQRIQNLPHSPFLGVFYVWFFRRKTLVFFILGTVPSSDEISRHEPVGLQEKTLNAKLRGYYPVLLAPSSDRHQAPSEPFAHRPHVDCELPSSAVSAVVREAEEVEGSGLLFLPLLPKRSPSMV